MNGTFETPRVPETNKEQTQPSTFKIFKYVKRRETEGAEAYYG